MMNVAKANSMKLTLSLEGDSRVNNTENLFSSGSQRFITARQQPLPYAKLTQPAPSYPASLENVSILCLY